MRAAAIIVALLVMLSGDHVTMRLSSCPVAVPVPALFIGAELAVCAVLVWLIIRAARSWPHSYTRRFAGS